LGFALNHKGWNLETPFLRSYRQVDFDLIYLLCYSVFIPQEKAVPMKTDYQPALSKLARRYKITAIYAFGSRAQEAAARLQDRLPFTSCPDSDLDMAVQIVPGGSLSAHEKVDISLALEDLFKIRRVDLVVLNEARPFLALDIIKGELLYCDDLDRQAEEELYVLRRAGDLAYYEQERRKMILQGESK
jgi:uncharacterized protein